MYACTYVFTSTFIYDIFRTYIVVKLCMDMVFIFCDLTLDLEILTFRVYAWVIHSKMCMTILEY